jgi:hypothetical protein
MSYAIKNDLSLCRAVSGLEACAEDETWSAEPVNPVFHTVAAEISPRQIRQALNAAGLRAAVETAVASSDQNTKDWWEFASTFERNHPVLVAMAVQLGMSTAQVDSLFAQAVSL